MRRNPYISRAQVRVIYAQREEPADDDRLPLWITLPACAIAGLILWGCLLALAIAALP